MLLGLAVRFGATLHDILSRLPVGGMVWIVLFVGGFCCTGLYLFETLLAPHESFWDSRQSVLLILPLYLFLMALAVYLAEHPLILRQWVDIIMRALQR